MSLSIPVWFCVVKSEPVTPSGNYAYRIIQAIKCQWEDVDRLYGEYQSNHYPNMGCSTMIFTREPDETPMKAMSLYPQDLMVDILAKGIGTLKTSLEQDGKFTAKDVDKWIDENFPAETQEAREKPEYKDW